MKTVSAESSLFADSATSSLTEPQAGEPCDDAPGDARTGRDSSSFLLGPSSSIGDSPADEDDVVGPLRRELPDNTSEKASPSDSPAEEAASWRRPKSPDRRTGAAALFSHSCSADAAPLVELVVSGLGVDDAMGAAERGKAKPKSQSRDTADNLRVPAYPPDG